MARALLALVLVPALLSCNRDLAVPGGGPPPEIGLVSPCRDGISDPCHDNAVVSGDVTVKVARTAGGELSAVELWTAGIEAVRLTAPPWSWTIQSKQLYPVGGVMPVYVTPIDAQGVRASPAQFSFIVDNAGPDVSISSPPHDTTWPMTLPVSVAVCAFDVQGVASVTASVGQLQTTLTQNGTCSDGRPQYTGAIAAPGGGDNTFHFDLRVQAQDLRGNVSNTYVPLVATRQRWSQAIHSPAQYYGGALAPVPQGVQHAFRAYSGGVTVQTASGNGGYVYWMPADGSPPSSMLPSTSRYSFAPYGDGELAVVGTGSPAPVQLYAPVSGTPSLVGSNTTADWGGIGELVGHGDSVACFATDANNFNPLFMRMGCFNHDGKTRFSFALNVLTDDLSALAVAGDVVLVLRQPTSACGIQFDRYTTGGALIGGSPCIYTRPLHPYVHADAYGAVVSTSLMAAHVDTVGTVTNVSGLATTYGQLLARDASGRLLWSLGDGVLLRTVVALTNGTGTQIGSTTLPFDATPPIGYSPTGPGGFDAVYSDAAAFDAAGNAYLVLVESSVAGDTWHVVSIDAAGALRWQYTTTPLMALSLSPAQTSEPLYLLHDDGTVEALVR
jgi:hypothetical protein